MDIESEPQKSPQAIQSNEGNFSSNFTDEGAEQEGLIFLGATYIKNKNNSPLNQNQASTLQIPDGSSFARPELLRDIEIPQQTMLEAMHAPVDGLWVEYDPLFYQQSPKVKALSRELSVGDPNSPVSPRHFPAVAELERCADVAIFCRALQKGELSKNSLEMAKRLVNKFENWKEGADARKRAEIKIARYLIDEVAPLGSMYAHKKNHTVTIDADKMGIKMLGCCTHAQWGTDHRREKVVKIHNEKCGLSKLCPELSRAETQRVIARYLPELLFHMSAHRRNRFQFGVLTVPNVPIEHLRAEMDEAFQRFHRLLRRKFMASVVGTIEVMENPLSRDLKTFNIHINVIFAISGLFCWETLRREWGYHLYVAKQEECFAATRETLRRRGIDPARMSKAELTGYTFLELSKYVVQTVPGKSASKGKKSKAPAFTDWPVKATREWIPANHGFRKMRTTGVFNDPAGNRWDKAAEIVRSRWLQDAELSTYLADRKWKTGAHKLSKEQRAALKDIILDIDRLDLRDVEWTAVSVWDGAAGYRLNVNLIQGDKFTSKRSVKRGKSTKFATGAPLTVGPPPDPAKSSGFQPDFDDGFDF